MPSNRKLAAIIFTDIVNYTKTMERDEQFALDLLHKQREIMLPIIEQHNGKLLKEIGDGTLMMFDIAIEAVWCAVDIQKAVQPVEGLSLRIGVHIGDVVLEVNDVFGSGVNVASRIESLAPNGGICISEDVWRQIRNHGDFIVVSLGKKKLKGINYPIEIFNVIIDPDILLSYLYFRQQLLSIYGQFR